MPVLKPQERIETRIPLQTETPSRKASGRSAPKASFRDVGARVLIMTATATVLLGFGVATIRGYALVAAEGYHRTKLKKELAKETEKYRRLAKWRDQMRASNDIPRKAENQLKMINGNKFPVITIGEVSTDNASIR